MSQKKLLKALDAYAVSDRRQPFPYDSLKATLILAADEIRSLQRRLDLENEPTSEAQ